jgi:hypothetical protein
VIVMVLGYNDLHDAFSYNDGSDSWSIQWKTGLKLLSGLNMHGALFYLTESGNIMVK